MSKKIMILGASILQLPAIKKAKEMGLDVIVVDMNPDAIGFKEKDIEREIISTIDTEKVLECAKKHRINGIITLASDMPMTTVARVSKELGLVGVSEDTALKATNKVKMRKALKDSKVPIPEFFCVKTEKEYYDAVNHFQQKCIVKPADNSGSRGVNLIDDLSDREKVEFAYLYSKEYSRSGEIVVEEFMEGPEVSVETLSVDGICYVIQITDKLTTGAPFFVEMGHSQPTHFSNEIKEQIRNIAIMANKAIGIENGPSHTEIKITANGPKIVEIGARLGGDCITTHLVPLSTGVDMVESCINIALGNVCDYVVKYEKAAAIRYFNSDNGEIIDIVGLENAKKIQGVKHIEIIHGIGKTVGRIKSSNDRVGFVISQRDNVEDAISTCNNAIEEIEIKIKEK